MRNDADDSHQVPNTHKVCITTPSMYKVTGVMPVHQPDSMVWVTLPFGHHCTQGSSSTDEQQQRGSKAATNTQHWTLSQIM
jgi:hypothetical protein